MFADATNPQFPSGTLADQEPWEYTFSEFQKVVFDEFDYGPNRDAKDSLVGHESDLGEAKIETLLTNEEEWNKTNWSEK